MKKVIDYIIDKKMFKPGEKVAVAVSGGMDSIALLDILNKNKELLNIKIFCLNINHCLRGKESDNECLFVENFAKSRNIPYYNEKIDVRSYATKQKMTIEQAARELRYKTLFSMMKKNSITKLCVAHHQDDQAETILMHIFRGSGLKGATGMEPVSGNYIVRPLLNITRLEIEKYIRDNNLGYVTDSSNLDDKYSRNYIRLRVLPLIKNIYSEATYNLACFAESCRQDENFINSLIPKDLIKNINEDIFIDEKIKDLHISLSSRIIRMAFKEIGSLVDIEQRHIDLVLNLFKNQVGRKLNMPQSIVAVRDYGGVLLTKKLQNKNLKQLNFEYGEFIFENFGKIIVEKYFGSINYKEKNCHYIDADKLGNDVVFRTRNDGDIFSKLGSGSKKLNDYFINKKISQSMRDVIPVLASKNNVLLVCGYDVGEKIKIDDNTKNIIKISYIRK